MAHLDDKPPKKVTWSGLYAFLPVVCANLKRMRQYLTYSWLFLVFFASQGRHVAPMGEICRVV